MLDNKSVIIGTCSICGGPVTSLPSGMAVCTQCGAQSYGPVIPMHPVKPFKPEDLFGGKGDNVFDDGHSTLVGGCPGTHNW